MSIVDAAQRAEALDTCRSFCVTAPAGSGKTGLLIQRFLALLARVERPEQVLAITFTRKAAAEMQERVAQALEGAALQTPVADDHEQVTRDLAEAALAAGERLGWQLLRDTAALNIKTIDSFCAGLTRQMPILSQFGGQASPADDADELYREAVRDLLALIDTDSALAADLRALLLHFDNNWDKLENLLVSMLSRRDQWQDYTGAHVAPVDAERRLLATVSRVLEERLAELRELLVPWERELAALLAYAADNLGKPASSGLPAARVALLDDWRRVAALLLTASDDWRKTVTVREGFPAGKGEASEWKARHTALKDELSAVSGLRDELVMLKGLPDMSGNSTSWQLVLHLSHILPNLAACLLLVFRRRGQVDHSQVAQSALDALGDDDTPTELALKLDYRIEHILVDEFQDTAINQYTLVSRLSRGWAEHNAVDPERPRTLFVVGDGMQSIYGFREANVGLFLKAQAEGFNGVRLEPLVLQSNFRSKPGIVDWVNQTFALAFPAVDNHRRGRVSFSAATAVKPGGGGPAVSLHGFTGDHARTQEGRFIAQRVAAALQEADGESIVILGRSRAQLAPTLAALRERGIAYAAQDMDPLETAFAITDLMTLCRALANPADRVAWFALLRAPWCGLALTDLQCVARWAERPALAYPLDVFSDPALAAELSVDGAARIAHLAQGLHWASLRRDRLGLRAWIEQTWLRLGGPACVPGSGGLRDADTFFGLLELADAEGVGLDIQWLQRRLTRLYATGDSPDARVQVMTLHKAKGLEFDWVFIPALAARPRSDSRPLLLWDDYVSPSGERGFLLAADDHCDDKQPTLYNFLRRHEKEKSGMEATRLLYVGATRAISHLHLSASLQLDSKADEAAGAVVKPPPGTSLLHSIWPTFRDAMQLHPEEVSPDSAPQPLAESRGLWRLAGVPPAITAMPVATGIGNIPERVRNRVDRHVGTVVHLALEELGQGASVPECAGEAELSRWRDALRSLGLHGSELQSALDRVQVLVNNTLADREAGRWLLDSGHADAQVELALTRVTGEGVTSDIIIDRSFLDRDTGQRWIIDYKTSQPLPGEARADFLARERASYRQQLRNYRDALVGLAPGPVCCALYFCAISHLEEVDPDAQDT